MVFFDMWIYFHTGNNANDTQTTCNNSVIAEEKFERSLTCDRQEGCVTSLLDGHMNQSVKKTRNCGHRAGFDAFMTGYCMATYLLQLGKRNDENELSLSSLGEIANKLSLAKKDVPLQIARSHFSKPSLLHTEKLKQLRENCASQRLDQ